MKNTAITLLAGLTLATAAQAGSDYSAKGKTVIAPPAPACLWTWFAGGSYGQIGGDWDEDIYTLHFGAEYKCPGSSCSQAIYLEVGYTEKDERVPFSEGITAPIFADHDVTAEIIPITLNYKYECALTGNLNWYVGGGAGVALVDIDIDGPFINDSDDDVVFYAHLFVGLTYNFSESFEIYGGARYVFMDDATVADISPLDEEVHYELGARFNF